MNRIPATTRLPDADPPPGYASAQEIVHRLRLAGHQAYVVGGGVRDLVMGVAPKDFDIVTSALPEETRGLFSRTIPVGADFGVIIVRHRGESHEVATFRTDGDYTDGRRPDWVQFGTLEDDVSRRDFTINGLVLDPETREVFDHTGGLEDINRRVLRTIGDPAARFAEDALRLLRAIRFACRLGFTIDAETRRALVAATPTIRRVSQERVLQELEAMWGHPARAQALRELHDTGLLGRVLPVVDALAANDAARSRAPGTER